MNYLVRFSCLPRVDCAEQCTVATRFRCAWPSVHASIWLRVVPGAYRARRALQPGAFPLWPQASPSATPLRGADGPCSQFPHAPDRLRPPGCVRAPIRGGPTLRSGIGTRLTARPQFDAGLRAPHPRSSRGLSRVSAGFKALFDVHAPTSEAVLERFQRPSFYGLRTS